MLLIFKNLKHPAAETAGRKSVKVKKRLFPPVRGGDYKGRVKKRSYHHPLPNPPPSRGKEL